MKNGGFELGQSGVDPLFEWFHKYIYIYIYICVCVFFLPAITEENIVFFTIKLWDYELQVNRTDPTDAT